MEGKETKVENKKRFSWKKTVLYTLLFVVFIPVLTILLLQLSPVQNALVDYFTKKINNSIEGEVSIDHIDISFRKGLDLEGFILKEASGDTILMTESLNVDLASSLYSLVDNSIAIQKIGLNRPTVKIVKYKGEEKSNIQLVLDKLFPAKEKTEPEGKLLQIDIKEIALSKLNLALLDENTQDERIVTLQNGSIRINNFLQDNTLDIAELILDRPIIRLKKFGESTVVETENVSEEVVESVESDSSDLTILLGKLKINQGIFSINDYNKEPAEGDVLDLSHFELSDIDLDLGDFHLANNQNVSFDLNKFDFIDDKGFEVKSLACQGVEINEKAVNFPEFEFVTDRTNLRESLRLDFESFDDFNSFEQKVELTANFRSSRVYFGDLMHFVRKTHKKGKNQYFDGTIKHKLSKPFIFPLQ